MFDLWEGGSPQPPGTTREGCNSLRPSPPCIGNGRNKCDPPTCRKWQWVGGLRVANAHCRCRIGVGLWYNTAIMSGSGCSEIKSRAREALFAGQYLRYAAAYFLLVLVTSFTIVPLLGILSFGVAASGIMPFLQPGGQPEIGLFLDPEVMLPLLGSVLIFSLLVIYPIGFVVWGQAAMAIAAMRRGLTVGHAFSGWGHGWKMGWLAMVKMTYLSLWSLLFFVPGVVKSLSYAMADFVAVDHPDWGADRCIAESCRLMKGNRWRYFVLNLSLLGWILLMMAVSWVPLCGNILPLFIVPYIDAAKASFYEDLLDCDDRSASGEAGPGEVTDYASVFEDRDSKDLHVKGE